MSDGAPSEARFALRDEEVGDGYHSFHRGESMTCEDR
jgi:hypothetical protein